MSLMRILIMDQQLIEHHILFCVRKDIFFIGGYFILKLKRKKIDNYSKIAKEYADFTITQYGLATFCIRWV